MINRKPDDICLLCKNERYKSSKTNSHIVPAPMLESVVGKRNREHSYSFNSGEKGEINEWYGREYPQTFTTEVKSSNFTYDYILCPECEEYFARIEGLAIPVLKGVNKEHGSNLKNKNLKDIDYIELQTNKAHLIQLLFFSILWRLIISDFIENGSFAGNIIKTECKLRSILLKYRELPIKELQKISLDNSFVLKVITSRQTTFPISQLFNAYSTNPFFFIAGQFIVFLYDTELKTEQKVKQLYQYISSMLNCSADKQFKVIVFPEDKYKEIINSQWDIYLSHLSTDEREVLKKKIEDMMQRIDNKSL